MDRVGLDRGLTSLPSPGATHDLFLSRLSASKLYSPGRASTITAASNCTMSPSIDSNSRRIATMGLRAQRCGLDEGRGDGENGCHVQCPTLISWPHTPLSAVFLAFLKHPDCQAAYNTRAPKTVHQPLSAPGRQTARAISVAGEPLLSCYPSKQTPSGAQGRS